MEKYRKTIDELLQKFEDLQISKITKQVNVINTGGPIGSSTGNNLGSVVSEKGETSIPTNEFKKRLKKHIPLNIEDDKDLDL